MVVPAVVIAESTRGDASDARVNQIIRRLVVGEVTEREAREAVQLKKAAGMTGVRHTIDALVVAAATLSGGGAILTSDPDDIRALASAQTRVGVSVIRT